MNVNAPTQASRGYPSVGDWYELDGGGQGAVQESGLAEPGDAIVAVNGRSTHVRRMKWDTFVGALGRRPLVLTVAKTTETPFEAAQLLDVAGTGGGGVMMNMSTGETKFTVQVDDPEAFKAFITDLQQYNAKQQAQAVAGAASDDKVTYGVNRMYDSSRRGSTAGVSVIKS